MIASNILRKVIALIVFMVGICVFIGFPKFMYAYVFSTMTQNNVVVTAWIDMWILGMLGMISGELLGKGICYGQLENWILLAVIGFVVAPMFVVGGVVVVIDGMFDSGV